MQCRTKQNYQQNQAQQMESEVQVTHEIEVFRPTISEFQNFGQYIWDLEAKCQISRAAKVI